MESDREEIDAEHSPNKKQCSVGGRLGIVCKGFIEFVHERRHMHLMSLFALKPGWRLMTVAKHEGSTVFLSMEPEIIALAKTDDIGAILPGS